MKASGFSWTGSLHGAAFRLEADLPEFGDFARQKLVSLFPEPPSGEAAPHYSGPAVQARLHWGQGPGAAWDRPAVRRWGRRLRQDGRSLLLSAAPALPGLWIEATWEDDCLLVEGFYRPASLRQSWLRRFGPGKTGLYGALLYYLVYFPLFHYLEQSRGWRLLHAAAVAGPDGAWIIAGLPGSGKTTFALSLLAAPQARLLSDNLLFFDARQVFACPEILHLSASSRSLFPAGVLDLLVPAGGRVSYERDEFRLAAGAWAWSGRPHALVFVGLAEKPELTPLPDRAAAARLEAFNAQANEIGAYTAFSGALDLIAPRPGFSAGWRTDLNSLLSSAVCQELWLQPGAPLAAAGDWLHREAGLAQAAPALNSPDGRRDTPDVDA